MNATLNDAVEQLIEEQLHTWPQAHDNYQALQQIQVKELEVDGYHYRIQYNPARIISSHAKVDADSIRQRACFLCAEHRPKAQRGIPLFEKYQLLVNPFPIFPQHLTIVEMCHVEQQINGRFGDMLSAARILPNFTIFYNGPHCGASAPDHLHFQAGNRRYMPIENEWAQHIAYKVGHYGKATIWRLNDSLRSTWVLESTDQKDAEYLFNLVYQALPKQETAEPMMNLLTFHEQEKWVSFIFPRKQHRPACYYAEDDTRLLCSPASVDMGGVFILPIAEDFQKITATQMAHILHEVCLPSAAMKQAENYIRQHLEPTIQVGILTAKKIEFNLLTPYNHQGLMVKGLQYVYFHAGKICWNGHEYDEILLEPTQNDAVFELQHVTIGLHFHWERQENQRFSGSLKLIVNQEQLTAVNIVQAEDYLTSVISSEMSATASPALLKAHAVISRSWLLAQLQQKKKNISHPAATDQVETDDILIRWYNHEDHTLFDVCADDHCQRYQGITRASTPQVKEALIQTRGEVLMHNGILCDARFSKCCGGAFEEFKYCWEDRDYPYLHRQRDWEENTSLPDLTQEDEAENWIRTEPVAFCRTSSPQILAQVLNHYDQETTDFYRWKITYSQTELSTLIQQRSGIDFGKIIDLQPLARGTSGRIWKLKIIGTQKTLILGKELEIRRILSPSHLYSSAFVVERETISSEGIPERFNLIGAGWGHGVGLCQIGAAVMGEQGYSYQEILKHYYKDAYIEKLY